MFCRRHVAKECSSGRCCNGTTDCRSNMVITGSNIGNKRSQYIERSTHTDCLLDFHIRRNLVKRHMSGAFYHNLNIFLPCTFCKFTQTNQFFNLADIGCVCKTAGTAGVAKRYGHIIFPTDIQNFIVILVKRILLSGHTHPCKYKGTATGDNIHLSFMFSNLLNGFSCNPAVKRYEIHSVLRMKSYNINEVFCCQSCKVSLIMNDTVVYGHSTNHCRAFFHKLAAEGLGVSVRGQIHDRLRSHVDCCHHLLHFDIIILAVSGYSKIHIDFRS